MKHIKFYKKFAPIVFCLLSFSMYANTKNDTINSNVEYNPLSKPNTYQNKDNPKIIAKYTKTKNVDGSLSYNIPSLFNN